MVGDSEDEDSKEKYLDNGSTNREDGEGEEMHLEEMR